MNSADFTLFQNLLKQRSGLVISPDKAYLLESRLAPVARKWEVASIEALAQKIKQDKQEALLVDVTEAMTTNETSFFRDNKPFTQFQELILPKLIESRADKKRIRIWCAACSSGQEPYSLAMILREEAHKMPGWTHEILGTDLSLDILDRAKKAVYSQFEVQRGLPVTMLVKFFSQNGDKWGLKEEVKKMVAFRPLNLLQDFTNLGQFDVIFCRNVLIYFDQETKTRVLENMARIIAPDGVLYLGGAETVLGLTEKFRPMEGQRGIYQPTAGFSQAAHNNHKAAEAATILRASS